MRNGADGRPSRQNPLMRPERRRHGKRISVAEVASLGDREGETSIPADSELLATISEKLINPLPGRVPLL